MRLNDQIKWSDVKIVSFIYTNERMAFKTAVLTNSAEECA